MKMFFTILGSGMVGIFAGFGIAAFFVALGEMTREEEARREYLTPDPWNEIVHPHDKFNDDINTN